MKNNFILIPLIISLALLVGCVSNPPIALSTNPEIQSLEMQLKDNNDPLIVGKLADAYSKDYDKSKDPRSRDEAIKYYKQYLTYSPEHTGAKIAIYSLLLHKIDDQRREDPAAALAELKELYENSEIIRRSTLASPSYMKAAWLLKRSRTDNDIKVVMSHLKESIKENPEKALPYILMAELQAHLKQNKLALATLRQAIRVSPDDVTANKALGNQILDNAYELHCVTQNESQLNEAAKAFKKAIKNTPDDFEAHAGLMDVFNLLGRTKLSLHEATLIHKNKNDTDSKFDLANALEADDQLNKSESLYLELLEKHPANVITLGTVAQLYTNAGQWEKADLYWKRFFKNHKEPSLYDYLMYSLVISHRMDAKESLKFFSLGTASLELTDWGKNLRAYQLNQLTTVILLDRADTKCEKTEAEFYVAYKYWLKNDIKSATTHFNNVLDLKVTPFREYLAADQVLKLIKIAN